MGSYKINNENHAPKDESQLIADSLLRQASVALQKRNYEEAGKHLTEALALARKNPQILAALAICLAEGESKFLSAEKLARRAICLSPRHPDGYHAIGRIYMLGGKWAQARDNLRRAAMLAPNNQKIREHLKELERLKAKDTNRKLKRNLVTAAVEGLQQFIARERQLVLAACLVVVSMVGFGLNLYAREVENREVELAQFIHKKSFQLHAFAYERNLLRHSQTDTEDEGDPQSDSSQGEMATTEVSES
jgi:tetratricopeptide (TPR) repeat protein